MRAVLPAPLVYRCPACAWRSPAEVLSLPRRHQGSGRPGSGGFLAAAKRGGGGGGGGSSAAKRKSKKAQQE